MPLPGLQSLRCMVGTWHALENGQFPRCFNMENLDSKRAKPSKCTRHGCASELSRERRIGLTRGQHRRVDNSMGWRIGCQTGGGPVHVLGLGTCDLKIAVSGHFYEKHQCRSEHDRRILETEPILQVNILTLMRHGLRYVSPTLK